MNIRGLFRCIFPQTTVSLTVDPSEDHKVVGAIRELTKHFALSCIFGAATCFVPTQAFAQTPAANASSAAVSPLHLVLIGDSTVCDYPEDQPDRGWGQFIEGYFKAGTVRVTNLAAAGRSSKTFVQEGRWTKALDEKPDLLLIQFGHNDSHAPAKPEATNAATDFKGYLRRYIDDARSIGATPILITPMVRRTFDAGGKIVEGPPGGGLLAYASAMKEVGGEKKVAVVDLHSSSLALAERLGPQASEELANKKGDVTHFNERGAKAMAGLVMVELPVVAPRLREYLRVR